LHRRGELAAGVVDQQPDRPEPRANIVEERVDLIEFANVARSRETWIAQLLDGLIQGAAAPPADRDLGAGSDKSPSRRPAYPGPSARHDRDRSAVRIRSQRRPVRLYHWAEYAGTNRGESRRRQAPDAHLRG